LLAEGKAAEQANFVQSRLHVITPAYFKVLGIPIEAGRAFTDADRHDVDRVMIISETVAHRAFPGVDPIGKRLTCCESTPKGIATHTVVGVVGDVHNAGPAAKIEPEFYLPLAQAPPEAWGWMNRSMTVLARPAAGDPAALTPLIRSAMTAVDKAAPVYAVSTMEANLATSIADATFNTILLVTLGALGLIFSAVGIYSVIGYFVTLRTPEIGIRIAVGATGAEVVGLLAREGMEPVVIGAAIGGMAAYGASRVLADALFNVTATDPATFVIVTALLLATGLVATIIPALRASRVDPTKALSQ
jgi:putative ABC transport system permease protein